MMVSCARNNRDASLTFVHLHPPEFPDASRSLIEAAVAPYGAKVAFHAIDDAAVAGLPLLSTLPAGSVKPVMWYRLFLPALLPDAQRVLYLDSDIVVLGSLRELWQMPLGGAPLAAVSDPWILGHRDWARQLGLPNAASYFNSGVLLLDLERFRAEALAERVLEHGRRHAVQLRWADQDSLNACLAGSQAVLGPRWNLLNAFIWNEQAAELYPRAVIRDASIHPAIVHYEGGGKPWINPHAHPYAWAYMKYVKSVEPSLARRVPFSVERELARRQMRGWLRRYRALKAWLRP